MSIAERVAWERGEILGKSVGYQVITKYNLKTKSYSFV